VGAEVSQGREGLACSRQENAAVIADHCLRALGRNIPVRGSGDVFLLVLHQ